MSPQDQIKEIYSSLIAYHELMGKKIADIERLIKKTLDKKDNNGRKDCQDQKEQISTKNKKGGKSRPEKSLTQN